MKYFLLFILNFIGIAFIKSEQQLTYKQLEKEDVVRK